MAPSKKHSSAMVKPSTLSANTKVRNCREYGEELVGSRIRVWWPIDHEFYKGVVNSFLTAKKKHRVLYDDGDQETLDMKKERWELLEKDDDKKDEDEIAQQDDSADESSDATPEPLDRKRGKGNGKPAENKRMEEEKPKKKQKIDTSSKRVSKKAVKARDDGKPTRKAGRKLQTDKNGEMGDVGGKIVAAASRMSGRLVIKENGKAKETTKALRSRKKVAEPRNLKQAVVVKGRKRKNSSKTKKTKDSEDDDDDTTEDEAIIPKRKRASSASEAVAKKQRTSSSIVEPVEEGDGSSDDEDGGGSSDDEDKPLVSFMKKLKGKEKEAGEGSSGNDEEAEEEEEEEAEEEGEDEAEEEEEAEDEAEEEAEDEEESS